MYLAICLSNVCFFFFLHYRIIILYCLFYDYDVLMCNYKTRITDIIYILTFDRLYKLKHFILNTTKILKLG